MNDNTYTIWVCRNCLFHHANGECGDCHEPEHEGGEPWALWALAQMGGVTMGMLYEEHACSEGDDDPADDCDCETDTFSMSSCEGCGSTYHGERHAFTVWEA